MDCGAKEAPLNLGVPFSTQRPWILRISRSNPQDRNASRGTPTAGWVVHGFSIQQNSIQMNLLTQGQTQFT